MLPLNCWGESDTDQNKNTIYQNARATTVKNITVARKTFSRANVMWYEYDVQGYCGLCATPANKSIHLNDMSSCDLAPRRLSAFTRLSDYRERWQTLSI